VMNSRYYRPILLDFLHLGSANPCFWLNERCRISMLSFVKKLISSTILRYVFCLYHAKNNNIPFTKY
jgi:hypothetical protein